jgi:hypothetical protein
MTELKVLFSGLHFGIIDFIVNKPIPEIQNDFINKIFKT